MLRRTLLAFLLATPALADDLESRLGAIVQRLDSEDASERDAAQRNLDEWCDAAGARAEELLRAASKEAPPEAAGRIAQALEGLREIAAARERLARFSGLRLPTAQGLRWVKCANPNDFVLERDEFEGWLVDLTPEHARLLTDELEVVEILRVRGDGGLVTPEEQDYEAKRRELLEGEVTEVFWAPGQAIRTLAIHARWALQRGQARFAPALLKRADEVIKAYVDEYEERKAFIKNLEKVPGFDVLLETEIGAALRFRAVDAAAHRAPFRDLLALWKTAAALQQSQLREEAVQMERAYASYVEEESKWVEPASVAALPPKAQAEYWVRTFREAGGTDEGFVNESGSILNRPWELEPETDDEGNPLTAAPPWGPEELVKLGDPAIEVLIEHLSDQRPTRGVSWWRQHERSSWYLLTVGNGCLDVLTAMTAQNFQLQIAPKLPDRANRMAAIQEAARAWWAKAKSQTAEERAVDALPAQPAAMAAKLLSIDARKWVPLLLDRAKSEPKARMALLGALEPHLAPENAPAIAPYLDGEDFQLALLTARILCARCGDDAGVRKIASKVQPPFKYGEGVLANLSLLLQVVTAAPTEESAQALKRLTATDNAHLLRPVLEAASGLPRADVAALLASFLDDDRPAGVRTADTHGRPLSAQVRDIAGLSLAQLAGFPEPLNLSSFGDRDDLIPRIRKWWEAEKDRIDWAALQKKAREVRK